VGSRPLRILEGVLASTCPKQVAAEFNVSLSTVTGLLKQTLMRLGSDCQPSRIPLGLVALTYAARFNRPLPAVYESSVRLLGVDCKIFMTPLPSLSGLFSPAVEDVFLLHAAGKSHLEIAKLRGRSMRTVANQLATAFQRIGSSGRLSAVEFLLTRGQSPRLEKLDQTG
jgi:DNA-binding CsgD family transcriptional regulator